MWLERATSLISTFVSRRSTVLVTASITSCGAGLFAGWRMAERKLGHQFEEELSRQVEDAKAFYKVAAFKATETSAEMKYDFELNVDEADLESAISALRNYSSKAVSILPERDGERVHGYVAEGHSYEVYKTHDEVIVWRDDVIVKREPYGEEDVVNVFAKAAEDGMEPFNHDEEMRTRTPDYPYVITEDEFMTNESGFDQQRLAYFEEDDVLVRENDEPVTDDDLVGGKNLARFGTGSNDKNIVYVRNVPLQMEFEITREQGSFAQVVHGFIQHDDRPRVKKFRNHRDE